MSKRKKIIIIAIILLALGLLFIGGNTFSKQVTEVKGKGVANVANWSFKVNNNEAQIQTINLASNNNKNLTDNKIAPGTSGNFQIKINAEGAEVGINYKISFINETNKPQNLFFIYNDKKYKNITEMEKDLTGTIDATTGEKEKNIEIYWEWPYETMIDGDSSVNDKIDTQDSKNIKEYTFDIKVEGVQVLPQTS